MFINLGRNAFDAGANTVTVRTQNGGAYLLVDVADNGPGVPEHVTEQLFKPFTTGGRAGGAGLGLAIARDLVRCHGGEIAMTETGPDRHDLPLHPCRQATARLPPSWTARGDARLGDHDCCLLRRLRTLGLR